MKKITCVLAILAAASTAAVAKDLKQDKKAASTISATQMSDAEMDKVTAGDVSFDNGSVSFVMVSGQNPNGVLVNPAGFTVFPGSGAKP